jgi:Acyl-CoA synthetase (NDP forming)
MIRVIRSLGFEVATRTEYGTMHLTFDLDPTSQLVAAIDDRDREADLASLRPLLAPRSVAVIGASIRPIRSATKSCATSLTADSPARCMRSIPGTTRCSASPAWPRL